MEMIPWFQVVRCGQDGANEEKFTAFLMIAREEDFILARLVPIIKGDLAIAQRPKCARSSASERPPFPISYPSQFGSQSRESF
jgi:hypothetical protein